MTDKEYNIAVNLHADNVFRFIVKNLQHTEDAKDVVQSAFERLWKNRDAVENEKCKSYLFTIAYNLMIDHIRKNKRIQLNDNFNNNENVVYQKNNDLQKTLLQAINKLNTTQRSLIMLKDYEGYNYNEIATITGLSESQVKVYLHRARIILKNYLVNQQNLY